MTQAVAFDRFISGIESNVKKRRCARAVRNGKKSCGVGCYSDTGCKSLKKGKPCLKYVKIQEITEKWLGDEAFSSSSEAVVISEPIGGMTHNDRILARMKFYDDLEHHPFEGEMEDTINVHGAYGRTPLHEAVLAGDIDRIGDLIAEGANASLRDNNSHTPYVSAKFEGNKEVMAFLESLDADIE